jgi:rod shape determining protein RodA
MQRRIKTDVLSNLDRPLILLYLILVFMGWFNIYAAVYSEEHQSIFDVSQQYGKQMIWIIAAFVVAIVVLILESRFYFVFSYSIYTSVIIVLLFVLVFGIEVNASKSWLEIGGVRIQPAEFGKFATCLALARYLSQYNIKIQNTKTLVKSAIILAIPAILILLQNDTGSAIVYSSFVLMLYRQGMQGQYLLLGVFVLLLFFFSLIFDPIWISIGVLIILSLYYLFNRRNIRELLFGIGIYFSILLIFWIIFDKILKIEASDFFAYIASLIAASLPLGYLAFKNKIKNIYIYLAFAIVSISFSYSVEYIFNNVLEKHQRTRINVMLGTESDPRGVEYNLIQSKIAIGSGGLKGKGFLQGTQTKFNFVPEQSTDFIFCTVGEEWGFIGTSLVIVLFLTLLLRIIYVAERQRSTYSMIFGYCVACVFFFHLAVNIGMTIGLVPVIGIPLPFFSYGGSSLWSFTIMLFIFIRLDADRDRLIQ